VAVPSVGDGDPHRRARQAVDEFGVTETQARETTTTTMTTGLLARSDDAEITGLPGAHLPRVLGRSLTSSIGLQGCGCRPAATAEPARSR
jgi:hypothetical protein